MATRMKARKRDEENVVLQQLMIAKTALQKSLKRVEQAIEIGDPTENVISQAEMFQNVLRTQKEFLEKERANWDRERLEREKEKIELRAEIERLKMLVESNESVSTLHETRTGEFSRDLLTVSPESNAKEGLMEKDRSDSNFGSTSSKLSVQDSIVSAMDAVDRADVLSSDFAPVAANGKVDEKENDLVDAEPVETIKGASSGPPPLLKSGDDDIYWVSQLHAALNTKGYYCGDDEVEDFYFGEGTLSALLTYQACNGLQETGTTDNATWISLLGSDLKPIVGTPEETKAPISKESETKTKPSSFSVLSEYDGGKEVHYFQVMLELAGYTGGKDDMEWWHFGDGTVAATKTFQACHGLPESGVADLATWKQLVGDHKTMEDVIKTVKQQNLYEEDMTNTDRVWLLGEQRWERKF